MFRRCGSISFVCVYAVSVAGRSVDRQTSLQQIHTQTICCRIAETFNKIINFLTYNFSMEQNVIPDDDLRIETRRRILSVLM